MYVKSIGSNMIEVNVRDARILVSYANPVAFERDGVCYKTDKRWSSTTSKHISKWLNGRRATSVPQHELDSLLELRRTA